MKISRKAILRIVVDTLDDVTDALTAEEQDEIADIVAERLTDECPEWVEDEEVDADEQGE